MLLQALHKYATDRNLLELLPFQIRTVHWLLPITNTGELRGKGFIPLTTPVENKPKPVIGRELLMPRFPGENNGGKAYFLAESFHCVLGVRKEVGETLPTSATGKDRNPVRAHEHFWERIQKAAERTKDSRLKALVAFRKKYLSSTEGTIAKLDWLNWQPNESSREKKPEWHGRTETGEWKPLSKFVTVGFEIDGQQLSVPSGEAWKEDLVWKDWAQIYRQEAFAELGNNENDESVCKICLVTGEIGKPVARSHKPKILGVPGLASGGYIVSFAKESPAFSSFGFEMGENASVSEDAAATYALGLNELLANDDTHVSLGGVTFCFWAEKTHAFSSAVAKLMNSAKPAAVVDFLKSPFAGLEREVAKKDCFLSVALSANAGRVVVREWLRLPLDTALEHLQHWFNDLEIVMIGTPSDDANEKAGPLSLFRLSATLVRVSKELDRMNDAITTLYRCALDASAPPLRLIEPILAEFRSALVTDAKNDPKYPFNQSRFALLKLILIRNAKKGGFMPKTHLCETDDAAYNLGRLLCVLAALQDAAHDYELQGPGIVERYYGSASTAPANVFGVLWKLHVHHLRKLEQGGNGGAAYRIREQIASIVASFAPSGPNQPPRFPQTLSLEEQGRFALGYYQQMAADQQARRDATASKNRKS